MSGATAAPGGSKSERAYAWLRARIARQEYAPGHRLALAPIAETLEMSAVPVREAIRRLEAEGLVTFERNVGARVTLIDEHEYVATMQTLGVVEGAATALAAPRITPAHLARAAAVNERMRRLAEHLDPVAFTRLNHEFHAVLYEQCPNAQLLETVHRSWTRLAGIRDSTFASVPDRARDSVVEHEQLLDLIRSGADALRIELAVRDHRRRTMDAFVRRRRADPDPDPSSR